MLKFRASQIGKLMTYPDRNSLSAGAVSAIDEQASQIILDWRPRLDMYVIEKGNRCEEYSIELLNAAKGKNYTNNKERLSTDLLTGEWDIFDKEENKIIDIKTAYSKKTFPLFLRAGDKKMYEWQLIAYMHLKDADRAAIAYCLVDTPKDIISSRDDEDWHIVGHLPVKDRVTVFEFDRCLEKEEQMLNRLELAQEKLKERLSERGYNYQDLQMDF